MAVNGSIKKKNIVIIGAGPAGLASAYELIRSNQKKQFFITIIDKNDRVGGLARTVEFDGCLFDVGPHRFYTKNKEVHALWKKMLGKDFVKVKRLTRMLYRQKFFIYPVSFGDVLTKLDPVDLVAVFFSFLYAKTFLRNTSVATFEDHITKNFGKKLFKIFFETYTEKVWGIKCNRIDAKWADQRIKNLNLWEVFKNGVLGDKKKKAKSLVSEFYYPLKGAGSMYEEMAKQLKKNGVKIILDAEVTKIYHKQKQISNLTYQVKGISHTIPVDYLLSSMPLTHFTKSLIRKPAADIIRSIQKIYYRDHITVNLVIEGKRPFEDNWIYIHEPGVKMARVANYNTMSQAMSKKAGITAVSVEYFAFSRDRLWKKGDEELIILAKKELSAVGLVDTASIRNGFVVREYDSYPVYYAGHDVFFNTIKEYVSSFKNLELIGRGGMFKYNNMDHSIYSGMLAARNIVANYRKYDTWSVNEDAEYLEEVK